MSLFKKESGEPSSPDGSEKIYTIFGPRTKFKGILIYKGSVLINGIFEGEITAGGDLVVGEGAKVQAPVCLENLVVAGELRGNVVATGSIEVRETGRIFGDIETPEMRLSRGAILEGRCVIKKKQAEGALSAPVSPMPVGRAVAAA